MLSADKWADAQGNSDPCTYGAGYLNIPAALDQHGGRRPARDEPEHER